MNPGKLRNIRVSQVARFPEKFARSGFINIKDYYWVRLARLKNHFLGNAAVGKSRSFEWQKLTHFLSL